jgi:methylase of polypeptide subunit release factors
MSMTQVAISCRRISVREEMTTPFDVRLEQKPAEPHGSARPQTFTDESSGLGFLNLDSKAIEPLGRVFAAQNLTQKGLRQALGPDASERLARADVPLYERRLTGSGALNTLLKLFTLRLWVAEPAARVALSPLSLEEVVAMGVLETGPDGVHARVGLSFCEGLWLFHDPMVEDLDELDPNHVLGTNPAAFTLANLTVRSPARWALDVGTGCGVQALLAARHSEHVIATDTNPRALNYTLFNARLNDLPNVECRLGSFFEPAAGDKFDLIVCNPPFVISPESQYLFRDGGRPADTLSEEVVRTAPTCLNEGGIASILCSWVQRKDTDWTTRPREWVAESGCDACLLRGVTQDPLSYAASWNRGHGAASFGQRLDQWKAYYQKLDLEALGVGAVLLRRRHSQQHWIRTDDLPKTFAGSCSDHLHRVIQAEDFLAQQDIADTLFDGRYDLSPDHVLHQTLRHEPGTFALERMELALKGGLQFRGNIDAATFQLLRRCDGRRTLRDILSEVAGVGKTTFDQIRGQASQVVRELIRCALLVPVPGARACEVQPPSSGASPHANSNAAPGI